MIAKLLAEAMEDGVPWDLHEARGRRRSYSGLYGAEHQAALGKGYVDLGLVDPEIVLNPENTKTHQRFPGMIAGPLATILAQKGVGFVRDPEGLIEKLHIDPQAIASIARTDIANMYREQADYDDEAEDWQSSSARRKVAEAILHSRVTVQPVQGRTGAGYKFVMKPSVREIEARVAPR